MENTVELSPITEATLAELLKIVQKQDEERSNLLNKSINKSNKVAEANPYNNLVKDILNPNIGTPIEAKNITDKRQKELISVIKSLSKQALISLCFRLTLVVEALQSNGISGMPICDGITFPNLTLYGPNKLNNTLTFPYGASEQQIIQIGSPVFASATATNNTNISTVEVM